ncbi:uncharacterized protein A4U43_C02F530 [Asparagus officinalis]|uniref:Uncharacterized protein n=1 Tax=Asparagus officinalis TaxID=4686 RepID=A0A5P1FER3_ASPOF|nr:alpha/beta-gliadin A-III-like isoform X1 [Asparagus officinalis]XP_020252434.1 alpha/beta-gliadin A-III-like isoform X1 [Asparagus officinalis]XP_020252435.1 alpha/beta-gliadin A-III-like isoform X1 [Asparagus officinalis]XP_020252436.1 alpha/beta-gliadin A-III-like isoform X1 [Asparagus officinalis]XP_020252437.1 alpha/beta-gliadin A-III-like isoform X1 [Asparagus officinalis]ONK76856.1 uncharacterized protein A4U43_C02F530 [Asparagus officinalis]
MPGAPQQHPMLIHPQQQAVSSQHPPIHMHPQPQPHPHPQMPPPQPSAHSQQSYPLPVPSAWRQHPMLMHPQQQGMSTQHSQSQGHLPPHQHLQVHPLKSHTTMPSQQQPAMPLPYGPGNLHPMQQQIQQAAQLCQFQQQAQRPLHPGQVLQQGSVHQHQHHPHKQSYMQQPAPRRPHPQLNYPPGHVFPPHQAQATNEQLPNQSYMGRANCSVPASSELPSGPIQQTLASHFESQAGVLPASPANPQQRASTLKRVGQMPPSEDGFLVKIAEGTKEREQILESASDSISELKDGEAARDAKEKESHTRNENKNGSKLHAKNVNVDGSMVKIPGEVTEGSHVVNVHDGEKKVEGQEGKFGEKSYEQFKGEDTHLVSKLHTQPGPDMSVKWGASTTF